MAFRSHLFIAVIGRRRHIVHHVDIQRTRGAAVVAVSGSDRKRLADAVGVSAGWVGVGAVEGVAVADHASDGVVVGDGQGITKTGGFRLRESRCDAVTDNADTAHGKVFQTIQRRHGEGPGLGQRRAIIGAAQRQVFLIDGDFAAIHLKTGQHHRIIVVMHLQDEIGRAGITVGIRQRIGEGFSPIATTVQGQELCIGLVQGVGVAAISQQIQGAVGADDGRGCHRASRDAVSALHIVAQHAAGQDQLALRGHLRITVIGRRRNIVDHVDIQRASGAAVVAVGRHDRKRLVDAVGISPSWVAIGAVEGVAVADHASDGVVVGDGQRITKTGGFGLREDRNRTIRDDADTAHGKVFQTIQRRHGEGPGLGQRRPIIGTAQRQVFLIDGDFAAIYLKTGQHHRIVVVMHLQDEIGRAGITVGVRQRIGEGFRAITAAVQSEELRIGLVQGVGVAAIGQQIQGAVGADDGCGCHRTSRDAVSTLHIIAQHAAGQDQLAL
ncbi:hypothetical protein [Pseudomonas sp. 25 R 14]|nr:hypothetical protein [Pseudomonas sp. 25 R 14]